jgi:transcriptional regulator with XRE-family HTH domain
LAEALELWPGAIEELAEAVGVRRNTLYVYASGRRTPPASLLRKVAELLEERTKKRAQRAKQVAKALRKAARS